MRLHRLLAAAVTLSVALSSAAGCGSARPRSTRIVLSLQGAAGRPVHGLDLTVALPKGAEVAYDKATGRISPGVITLREGALHAIVDAHYVSHETAPFIRVLLASRDPMRDGEVAAVELTVVSAATPPRERFEVVRAAVAGEGGGGLPGATGWVSEVEVR